MAFLKIPSSESKANAPDSRSPSPSPDDLALSLEKLDLNEGTFDHAELSNNPQFTKMIAKHGDNFPYPEKLTYSRIVTKINRKGKEQERIFVATNKALYNLAINDLKRPRRRIDYDAIASVSTSTSSNEFAFHVPSEYDYRFKSDHRGELIKIVGAMYKKCRGCRLKVVKKYQSELINAVMTKDVARLQTREQRLLRYKELVSQPVESDNEEAEDFDKIQAMKAVQPMESLKEDDGADPHDEGRGDADDGNKEDVDSGEQVSDGNKYSNIHIHRPLKCEPADFEFLKVIGRGSFGKVMLVKKKDNNKLYAMKILKKKAIIARRQIEHTKAERRILESLQHPFCMTLRYAFQTFGKLYLVLDFYRGGELFFHLKRRRKFTQAEGKIIVAEVALALGHLHTLDIIYRDLKPENILMDLSGHVCITDFGLSKELINGGNDGGKDAITHTFCGTPEYLAPEIVMHAGHGIMVDWWTLGVLAYELLVGIPPFYSQNVNEMYRKIQEAPLLFPNGISKPCQVLIAGLLQRDPSKRLGCDKDVDDVTTQEWFNNIDFPKLMRKEVEPVYKPVVDEKKLQNNPASMFDAQFTNEPIVDSFAGDAEFEFAEFSYQTKQNIM